MSEVIERESPSWHLPAMIVLGSSRLVACGFGWNASTKLDTTQQTMTAQIKQSEQSMQQDMSSLKDRLAQDEKANADLQGDLKVVTDKLKITQGQLKNARRRSRPSSNDATTRSSPRSTPPSTPNSRPRPPPMTSRPWTPRLAAYSTDLNSTKEDLKMARSEMGTLIARNHDEIDQLRRLGERDYVEFTIDGKNKPHKVGNVTVELKGVNEKKNQFTVAMTVEDKHFEKKNRAHERADLLLHSGHAFP